MQYQSVLLTTIEISVVFFGFIIVFLTFVMGGKDQRKADRMHSRALLVGAFPLLVIPFIPLVVDAYGGSEAMAWRAFHIGGFLLVNIAGAIMLWFYLKLNREEVKEVGYLHSVVSWGSAIAAIGFFSAGMLGYAPAGNALAAILCILILTATSLLSFAAQQMSLFDWRNP
jgi:hypothetical protein